MAFVCAERRRIFHHNPKASTRNHTWSICVAFFSRYKLTKHGNANCLFNEICLVIESFRFLSFLLHAHTKRLFIPSDAALRNHLDSLFPSFLFWWVEKRNKLGNGETFSASFNVRQKKWKEEEGKNSESVWTTIFLLLVWCFHPAKYSKLNYCRWKKLKAFQWILNLSFYLISAKVITESCFDLFKDFLNSVSSKIELNLLRLSNI